MDRTAQRRERLRGRIKRDRVDGLLIVSESNVAYLTGFTGDSSALVLTGDRAIVVSDGRFVTQLEQECPELEVEVRALGQPLVEAVAGLVEKLGPARLAFESEALSAADFLRLKERLTAVELRPVSGRVEALRAIKDRAEVAAIREAIAIAERAFAMLRAGLRRDESEKDAADGLEGYLRRCGATTASFSPIVAVGVHSALPHARPQPETPIGDADFVLVDWGATARSYKSDLTRVVVTGKVTAKFAMIYRTVLAAQQRAIAAIRPGVTGREVDAEARSVIEEAGFGCFFRHGLGHGLGLEIHEAPRLHMDSQQKLQPGMVVTVEPGIYLPDWGGIRIEDDVLVTPEGCDVLSRSRGRSTPYRSPELSAKAHLSLDLNWQSRAEAIAVVSSTRHGYPPPSVVWSLTGMPDHANETDEPLDVRTIRHLVRLMKRYDLTAIDFIEGETKIRLRRRGADPAPAAAFVPAAAPPPALVAAAAPRAEPAPQAPASPAGVVIESPMVGTYYASSSPDAPPFVTAGSVVRPDTTVCVIEAMKVFTDIPAGVAGAITEVLVKNGQSVEFGQPLFRVNPA